MTSRTKQIIITITVTAVVFIILLGFIFGWYSKPDKPDLYFTSAYNGNNYNIVYDNNTSVMYLISKNNQLYPLYNKDGELLLITEFLLKDEAEWPWLDDIVNNNK